MTKKARKVFVLTAGWSLMLAGLVSAQSKQDFLKSGDAVPPVTNLSEDYPLVYIGGVPSPIQGDLDADDSTYNRVLSGCGGLSGVGTAVSYDTISITNTTAVTANFIVETSNPATPGVCTGIDTFMTAYLPTFNPVAPATNCLASDDDAGAGACSRIIFAVPAAGTAVIVVTSFGNGVLFPYQVNFEGTTPVELTDFRVE